MRFFDVVIIGAGAAGLTAAIFAANGGARVCLLERTDRAGRKILMSGGTRCNVLPVRMSPSDYTTDSSPNLLKRIFKSWSVERCKDWFEKELGLNLACEEHSNKWFPVSNSAIEVRDLLLKRALNLGVEILYNQLIDSVHKEGGNWVASDSTSGIKYSSPNLIVATGGLSVPKSGTDGSGHKFLKDINVPLKPTYPALTPLSGPHPGTENLAGVSLKVELSTAEKSASREGFLFTHKGYSGPSVLDLSHYATRHVMGLGPKPDYRVNWTGIDVHELEDLFQIEGRRTVQSFLKLMLPRRVADALETEISFKDRRLAELSRNERNDLKQVLTAYPLPWASHEGYRKAEVTGGGVPLEALNTATMELKDYPGLIVCGEIIDVFGRIGGFNFYWAWVSGRLAGMFAAKRAISG